MHALLMRPRAWSAQTLCLAALPWVVVPCAWLWYAFDSGDGFLQPGYACELPLLALAVLAMLMRPMQWHAALVPLLLALAWLGAAQWWNPVPEIGMLTVALRGAAVVAAIGWMAWLQRRFDAHALPMACGWAGLGILALTAATQCEPGASMRIGQPAPFGNVNYSVHLAMPLLAISVAYDLRKTARRALVLGLCGAGLATILGAGIISGDTCRASWLGMVSAVWAVLLLRCPRRWHAGLAIMTGVALVAGWAASFMGGLDPARFDWGVAQRIYMWRASVEALADPAIITGYGASSCLAVLPDQPSFQGFWLTLPGWTSHPHNEALSVLLDGGIIFAGFLVWALLITLVPLWKRRDEPLCAALLVGWFVLACGAMVETHLREPGGMLVLALICGMSWAHAPSPSRAFAAPRWLLAVPTCLLALCVGGELIGDGGPAKAVVGRARARVEALPVDDHRGRQAELERLRRRVGALDDLDYHLSVALGSQGRLMESMAILASQLRRMPCYAPGIALAGRMLAMGVASPPLREAHAEALRLASGWLERVPENERNREARRALQTAISMP